MCISLYLRDAGQLSDSQQGKGGLACGLSVEDAISHRPDVSIYLTHKVVTRVPHTVCVFLYHAKWKNVLKLEMSACSTSLANLENSGGRWQHNGSDPDMLMFLKQLDVKQQERGWQMPAQEGNECKDKRIQSDWRRGRHVDISPGNRSPAGQQTLITTQALSRVLQHNPPSQATSILRVRNTMGY